MNGRGHRQSYPCEELRRRGPEDGRLATPERSSRAATDSLLEDDQHLIDLEGAQDMIVAADELGLMWGVAHEVPGDDGEFKLRLLQHRSDSGQVRCVEMCRESFELLGHHETKIRSLMLARDKALLFQNLDIQVYVMEELKEDGFRVHFQDRRRTKVSLTYRQFLGLTTTFPKIDGDYLKFKKKLKIKKNKLKAKLKAKGIVDRL